MILCPTSGHLQKTKQKVVYSLQDCINYLIIVTLNVQMLIMYVYTLKF